MHARNPKSTPVHTSGTQAQLLCRRKCLQTPVSVKYRDRDEDSYKSVEHEVEATSSGDEILIELKRPSHTYAIDTPWHIYVWRLVTLPLRILAKQFMMTFFQDSFWPPTPPKVHASDKLATLLLNPQSIDRAAVEAIGIDATGHYTVAPLADITPGMIEQLLGCAIIRPGLYRKALTHSSAVIQEKREEASYEQLEWLGDAVLELATRSLIMRRFKTAPEGPLTQMTQSLVNGQNTAGYASLIHLEKYMVLNIYSMRETGGQIQKSVMADGFEALVGALYLDRGLQPAIDFVNRIYEHSGSLNYLDKVHPVDFKGRLSRYARSNNLPHPAYTVIKRKVHKWRNTEVKREFFTCQVTVGGEIVGKGGSYEKKFAEQLAAKHALISLYEQDEEL